MDQSVLKAMIRWPDVPAVYGWLSLDRRGQWRLRGEVLSQPAIRDFINRNYARDVRGCWYFQNGPQRVFVSLKYTPWVYRLHTGGALYSHTGVCAGAARQVFMDENGAVLFDTVLGIGLLDDRDLSLFSNALGIAGDADPGDEAIADQLEALADGRVAGMNFLTEGNPLPLQPISRMQVAAQFEFDPDPQAPGGS